MNPKDNWNNRHYSSIPEEWNTVIGVLKAYTLCPARLLGLLWGCIGKNDRGLLQSRFYDLLYSLCIFWCVSFCDAELNPLNHVIAMAHI